MACGGLAAALGAVAFGHAEETSYAKVQHGKYLVDAADCIGCHTRAGGAAFAGGRPIDTPFGTIYSPNLTPDNATGLGAWSEDDFYGAMHNGEGPDGTRLYPAFPYPYYTKLTRDDVAAIWAYLRTLEPVHAPRPPSELTWPLNYRVFMRGWDWMFFTPGEFKPNPQKSAEWNRGAYLVEGAGHCGACHTPKNFLGADDANQMLQGGELQNWFAPKLANGQRDGLGTWSVDETVEYLKTGRNARSGATGPMAEVIENSTSKMTDADLRAIAVYVKDMTAQQPADTRAPDQKVVDAGKAIFTDSCSGCHQADGSGVAGMFPPLVRNSNVQSDDPTTIIRVVLEGARTAPTDARPTPFSMPAYDWKLNDDQVAAVVTYVRNAWGNKAPAVSAGDVASLRGQLQAKTQ